MALSIYKILEHPFVYTLAQRILAPGAEISKRSIYKELFDKSSGCVLDVGCGPVVRSPLTEGQLIGIDENMRYVRKYKEFGFPYHACGLARDISVERYGVVGNVVHLPFRSGSFDDCRCFSVLHHLPDQAAMKMISEMCRVCKPNGRIVLFDYTWPSSFVANPVAWSICAADRGEWVRKENDIRDILFAVTKSQWEIKSFRFAWTRLEGRIFIYRNVQPENLV